MSDDEIDAYYDEMAEDAQNEGWREDYKREMEQERYDEEQALRETLEDAAREDCYADYSGGRKPEMTCDYHTETSSNAGAWDTYGAIFSGAIIGVGIAWMVNYINKSLNIINF